MRILANVAWVHDDADEPGPVRMAAAITRFADASDKARLIEQIGGRRWARAA